MLTEPRENCLAAAVRQTERISETAHITLTRHVVRKLSPPLHEADKYLACASAVKVLFYYYSVRTALSEKYPFLMRTRNMSCCISAFMSFLFFGGGRLGFMAANLYCVSRQRRRTNESRVIMCIAYDGILAVNCGERAHNELPRKGNLLLRFCRTQSAD